MNKDWKIEFDKEIMCKCEGNLGKESGHTVSNPEMIKQFISTLLLQHQEEMVKEIEDFRQSVRNEPVSSNFDIAFDDFLTTLKSNKE